MRKGLILINAYSESKTALNQSIRLSEEFRKLGVDVCVRRNDFFICEIRRGEILRVGEYDFCVYLDKDRYISEMLEKTGLRLFNSHEAIANCDDKMVTYLKLANCGIRLVDTVPAPLCYDADKSPSESAIAEIERRFGYPVVAKECFGSLGKGVHLCRNRAELARIAEKLKLRPHLFQRFVSESRGRDVRVITVGGKCVASMLRESDGDFRSNLELGGKGAIFEPTREIREQAERASEILGLDYAGIDFLFGDSGFLVCEVNSNAFFGGMERVANANVARLYAEHICDEIYG